MNKPPCTTGRGTRSAEARCGSAARGGAGLLRVALILAMLCPLAAADEIKYGGIAYKNVRIVGMRDGKLYFEGPAGEQSVSLVSIESLKLDKYPELERADQAIEKKQLAEAAMILSPLAGKLDEDYLKVLVLAKLVYTLDNSGKYGEALTRYVQLLSLDDGTIAPSVAPRNPPVEAAERAALQARVAADAAGTADPIARAYLTKVAASLKLEAGAAPLEAADPSAPVGLVAGEEAQRDFIADLIRTGKPEQAMTAIDTAMRAENAELAKLFHMRGRAQAVLSKDMDAIVSHMRVVIHFPQSQFAQPSMVEAGKLFQKIDKPHQAEELWKEARRLTDDPARQKEIDDLLASLK